MSGDGYIETGVDKLVKLIEDKKRISTTDAAKTLGVSSSVIDEWSDFLEEEGLISLEYKLATTYLVERRLSKKEVVKKAKEFYGSKDAFVRKIETALQGIEKDTKGLGILREKFMDLKNNLGSELSDVQVELKQLEHFEKLKKGIDKQMNDQQNDFQKKIDEMDKELFKERSKYKELLDDLQVEKIRLEEEKSDILSLKTDEKKLMKKIDDFKSDINLIRKNITSEEDKIEISEDHIEYFEKVADKLRSNILAHNEKLDPLIKDRKTKEQEILSIQDNIMKKVMSGTEKIKSHVKDSSTVARKFKAFLDKKREIEDLLDAVDKDKLALEAELKALIKKAHGFDIVSKKSSVKGHIQELNKKYKEIEKKRENFKKEINKLIKAVKDSF